MNQSSCRLLPFTLSDGPGNMAADEAMLVSAQAGEASFRLYGWTNATLSLGYFQPAALRETDPLLANLPLGGAQYPLRTPRDSRRGIAAAPRAAPRSRCGKCHSETVNRALRSGS